MSDDQKAALVAEVERLARKVQELKGLSPDAMFYRLPLWVQAVSPEAIEIVATDNPLWDEFREAGIAAFNGCSRVGKP